MVENTIDAIHAIKSNYNNRSSKNKYPLVSDRAKRVSWADIVWRPHSTLPQMIVKDRSMVHTYQGLSEFLKSRQPGSDGQKTVFFWHKQFYFDTHAQKIVFNCFLSIIHKQNCFLSIQNSKTKLSSVHPFVGCELSPHSHPNIGEIDHRNPDFVCNRIQKFKCSETTQ